MGDINCLFAKLIFYRYTCLLYTKKILLNAKNILYQIFRNNFQLIDL